MKTATEFKVPGFLREFLHGVEKIEGVTDKRYNAKIVETPEEFEAVLRLRYDVFETEIAGRVRTGRSDLGLDFDEYDAQCDHLIVTERESGEAVGTYRLNSIETAGSAEGFYASGEFSIEDLPPEILSQAVELGRACIAKAHRNSRVLFLLWKVLANYITVKEKRYLFGCCSIFTQDGKIAANVLKQLHSSGHVHKDLRVSPREDKRVIPASYIPLDKPGIELPALVNIYLRIGAKICGEPAIDRDMKTVDYFVVFDLEEINSKYRRMFFG